MRDGGRRREKTTNLVSSSFEEFCQGSFACERESKQAKGAKEKETKREKKNVLRGTSVFARVCNSANVPQALPTVHGHPLSINSLSSADR